MVLYYYYYYFSEPFNVPVARARMKIHIFIVFAPAR